MVKKYIMKIGVDISVVKENIDMVLFMRDLLKSKISVVVLSHPIEDGNPEFNWVEVQTGANVIQTGVGPRSKMYTAEDMNLDVYFTDNIDHREYLSKETKVNAILVV